MTSYSKSLSCVLRSAKILKQKVPVSNSINHISSTDIKSKKNNPSFNNSLLDGFVFKSSDTKKNKVFKIIGELAVGQNKKIKYKKNSCYRVSTGGKIISPYDCMIPYEQVKIFNSKVIIKKSKSKNANVRLLGSDYKKNQIILKKNNKISSSKILTIKSLANKDVNVYQKPNLVLFCSGDEITDKVTNNNQIINGIPEYISSFKDKLNFNFNYLGIVKDNQHSIKKIFNKIKNLKNTILISTGGVSAGHKDFFPKFLKSKKYQILFHRILMRPGRPTLFAKKNSNYYFGLPGNPISTIVGFHFLITPLILKLQNQRLTLKQEKIIHNYKKTKNLTLFLRGYKNKKGLKVLPGQDSYKLDSLTKANCWIKLDQKSNLIKKGSKVSYFDYEN
jgi:molybdopterin molybdotransferase